MRVSTNFSNFPSLFPLRLYWLTGLVLPAVIFRVLRKKMPVDTYWQQALAKAQTAITLFPSAANVSAFTGIETLFPFIQHPTPLQQKALELDINVGGA